MSYSDWAWKGISRYFAILERIHYSPPITWDSAKGQLKVVEKRPSLLRIISIIVTILYGFGIPIFIFGKELFGIKKENEVPLNIVQIIVLIVFFFTTLHGIPIFMNFSYVGRELVTGFNYLILLEKHIRANQVSWKAAQRKYQVDIMGILTNCLGPGVLAFPSCTVLLVYIDADMGFHIVPDPYSYGGLLLREILAAVSMLEAVTTIAAVHLILMTMILHTKSIYTRLKLYKRSLANRSKWDFFEVTKYSGGGQKILKLKNQVAINAGDSKVSTQTFDGINDLLLYKLVCYFFNLANKSIDVCIMFALFPGFALDVAMNYALLTCFHKVPLIIYFFVILAAIIIPTLFVAELPQASKTYEACENLLLFWRTGCPSKGSVRYKTIRGCKPVGYSMGGIFTFRISTVATFFEALMDYTVNAVMSI